MKSFSINGFGRIGRLAARGWWQKHRSDIQLAASNTSGSMDIEGWAHLLKYDTTYGRFDGEIAYEKYQSSKEASDEDPLIGHLILGGTHKIPVFAQRDPAKIPWGKYKAEVVLDSKGPLTSQEKASPRL